MNPKVKELAKMIDHSILHPTLTDEDLRLECEVAKKYDVASVCVKPYAVKQALPVLALQQPLKYWMTRWKGSERADCVINPTKTGEPNRLNGHTLIRKMSNIWLFSDS